MEKSGEIPALLVLSAQAKFLNQHPVARNVILLQIVEQITGVARPSSEDHAESGDLSCALEDVHSTH